MNYPELLIYWIRERYAILQKKQAGQPAPWSEDPVFQTTYFCNVRREDDKVTKFIRAMYSPWVGHELFEYNMVLARLLNRPLTLEAIGYRTAHAPDDLVYLLRSYVEEGATIWGSAYVITTHGQKMDKLAYLAQVLELVHDRLDVIRGACRGLPGPTPATCHTASGALQLVDGLGSFLAGQVVADLKNTTNHPLYSAADKATFVVPGPGSIRGVKWFFTENQDVLKDGFQACFQRIRDYVDASWPAGVPRIDNQDLQNCLCEFDKYCRVKTGTGRSKRKYAGTNPRA